ncbi:MAG: lipoprotein-releasing system ATP-binding protein LolD, partial [Methanogenium sp.]|nr:lipoprotein-releasing system ATP-binding protein LolD [Methanogenium sp.]
PLLLADEPTGNLDSQTSFEVFKLMQEINQEHETTFIVVTHEREFGWYSNRTIEIKDGKVVV